MKNSNRNYKAVGIIVSVSSFILLLTGIRLLLDVPILPQNFTAILILSFLFGLIAAAFYYFKRKIAFYLFLAGLAAGFFEMSRLFLADAGGWGDLAGLASLFVWVLIGLACGGIFELSRFLYKKIILNKRK